MTNKKELHLMIDIETMGTNPDSSVFQICVVPFLPSQESLGEEIDAINAYAVPLTDGRGYTDSTLKFWLNQNFELYQEITKKSNGRTGFDMWGDFIIYLLSMHDKYDIKGTWGNGPSFDQTILRNGINQYIQSEHARLNGRLQEALSNSKKYQSNLNRINDFANFLMPFYLDLDVRTATFSLNELEYDRYSLANLLESSVKKKYPQFSSNEDFKKHNAFFDCLYQIELVQLWYSKTLA